MPSHTTEETKTKLFTPLVSLSESTTSNTAFNAVKVDELVHVMYENGMQS